MKTITQRTRKWTYSDLSNTVLYQKINLAQENHSHPYVNSGAYLVGTTATSTTSRP